MRNTSNIKTSIEFKGLAGYFLGEGSTWTAISFAASILVGGYDLFKKGVNNLFRLQFDMNTLMTVAIIGAAAIGKWWELPLLLH